MPVLRIYFIHRGIDLDKQLIEITTKGPDKILEIGKSPLPENGKIRIKVIDVKFHPIDEVGRLIPANKEEFFTFDVASQIGNSETGDVDVFAYALPDD